MEEAGVRVRVRGRLEVSVVEGLGAAAAAVVDGRVQGLRGSVVRVTVAVAAVSGAAEGRLGPGRARHCDGVDTATRLRCGSELLPNGGVAAAAAAAVVAAAGGDARDLGLGRNLLGGGRHRGIHRPTNSAELLICEQNFWRGRRNVSGEMKQRQTRRAGRKSNLGVGTWKGRVWRGGENERERAS